MVYRLHGSLLFATAAARNAAQAGIAGAVAITRHGLPALELDRNDPSAIPMQSAYTTTVSVANTNAVQPGSSAYWHACYHGDLVQACATTGRTDW